MIKNIELEKGAYQFDAKMPLRQAIPLGLQHVFAMFVGNLTPLLIITSACGLAGGEFADLQVSLLQNAMFVAGVVTLVQLFSIGPVGGQVPIIMAPAPASWACSTVWLLPWAAVCWPTVPSWALPSWAACLRLCWASSSSPCASSSPRWSPVRWCCPSVCP